MSNIKLTLSLDETVIKAAKVWAKANNTSLSKVFEDYLMDLLKKKAEAKPYIDSRVRALRGIARVEEPPADYKTAIIEYLEEKYLNEDSDR
jgi:hypothetical protein